MGYRAHKGNAVAKARKDGKVIRIRLAGPTTTPGGATLLTPREGIQWPELDPQTQTAATGQFAGYSKAVDLGWRSAWSELIAAGSIAPDLRLPAGFSFAPLSARHFCAGHTFWVQQGVTLRVRVRVRVRVRTLGLERGTPSGCSKVWP